MEKIFIIDDEPDIAELMKLVLEKEGYYVRHSLDPRKGLEMVKDFDLLVLDLLMPHMSGLEILAELRRKGAGIPIIVVSALDLTDELKREFAEKYPDVEYLSKLRIHKDMVKAVKNKLRK